MKCLQQRFSNVFSGIGKHKYRQVKLIVDESVKPVVQAMRRIPFAKMEKLEKNNPQSHIKIKIRKVLTSL